MKKLFVTIFALLAVGLASAQSEVIAKFNDAVAAMQNKNYAGAIPLLESAIDKGMDSEDSKITACVDNAKKNLVQCYRVVGSRYAAKGDYDKAITYLKKAAETADLYGNSSEKNKANAIIAKVYQVQGGKAFNAKDYATAAAVFEKGYAANPRNTEMALNLASSYCELGKYNEGMAIYNKICKMPADKYATAIAKAKAFKKQYTLIQIALMQAEKKWDDVIVMADKLQAMDPAAAEEIRLKAYSGKKDYTKVIELGETAAAAQTSGVAKSDIYFLLGAAYNDKYNASGNKDIASRDKAIATLKKVTAGASVEAAKAALAELTK